LDGEDILNARGNRKLLMALGHLKAGVTPAQAIADLNSIGSYLERSYPKDDVDMKFTLVRPGLAGDFLGGPVKAFVTGLMLLAGLIHWPRAPTWAACLLHAPRTVPGNLRCVSR